MLVNHSLNSTRVLRLTPPAVVDDTELDLFFTILADALTPALHIRLTRGNDSQP